MSTASVILSPEEIDRAMVSTRPRVGAGDDGRMSVDLPPATVKIVAGVLAQLSAGHVVTLIPERAGLSVEQAAELLMVSGAFVEQLLSNGDVPCRNKGSDRVIEYGDLMEYKARNTAARERVLAELAREAQELGMGY